MYKKPRVFTEKLSDILDYCFTDVIIPVRGDVPRVRGGDALGERKWGVPGGLFSLRARQGRRRGTWSVPGPSAVTAAAEEAAASGGKRLVVHGGAPLTAARRELWCLAHAMTVAAAAVTLWHRAHLYKALACIVLALIAVQYLLSGGVLDRRSIETIFTINATRWVPSRLFDSS